MADNSLTMTYHTLRSTVFRYITAVYTDIVIVKRRYVIVLEFSRTSLVAQLPWQRHTSIAVAEAAGPKQRCSDVPKFWSTDSPQFCQQVMLMFARCHAQLELGLGDHNQCQGCRPFSIHSSSIAF